MAAKRIRVISTGGTISTEAKHPGRGLEPSRSGFSFIKALEELGLLSGIEVEVEDYSRTLSTDLSLPQIHGLALRIREVLRTDPGLAGVVVTHGTGTLEESAFWADLLHDDPRPVVFTGAMRSASHPFPDGLFNLWGALRVAADSAARNLGVLVVFDEAVYPAQDVVKVHTTRTSAFEAPEYGPVGRIYPDGIRFARRPLTRITLPPAEPEYRVDLLKFVVGVDDHLVRASLAWGSRGLVVEGSGLGNVNTAVADALVDAAQMGVAVVLASRCFSGRVVAMYPAAVRLTRAGCMVTAFPGPKARILLMLALGAGVTGEALQALLDPAGRVQP